MSLVLRSTPADGVVLLQLNRPEARNALNLALRQAIAAEIDAAAADPAVRVAVLTGDDKAFAAGADLKAIATATPADMEASGLHHVWASLSSFPKPLVAAVRGFALGAGSELAMHADILVVGEGATIGQPEIKVGVMPGAGGVQRLVRLVGYKRAMRLLLTGAPICGRTAYEWGLASDLAPDAEVLDRALAHAAAIAALPAGSAALIKKVALAGADLPLQQALDVERRAFWSLFGTPDQREGMAAFVERRPPRFNGSDEA